MCIRDRRYREQGITHIRCQSGGYGGGGYGKAPASAPEGALDGIYLDSKKYMRDTLKPVSYTHLDVYKRQTLLTISISNSLQNQPIQPRERNEYCKPF